MGYALNSVFGLSNFYDDKEIEQALNALVQKNALKYGVDIYEKDEEE